MSTLNPRTTCPTCSAFAAVHSRPHCLNKACKWNVCTLCGFTYDRHTGTAFKQDKSGAQFKAAA